jgi:hypothetical protein
MSNKVPTNASKLNHELRRAIVRQLKLRRHVRTWGQIAKLHKISRRNLMGHIRKIRAV